jgi:hypothetical protein
MDFLRARLGNDSTDIAGRYTAPRHDDDPLPCLPYKLGDQR